MKNKVGRKLLLLAAAAVFMFSAGKVLNHRLEMRAEAQHTEELVELAVHPAPERAEESETVVETAPIEVDFDALRAKNPDVVYVIGDNPDADIKGGKNMGYTTIAVHECKESDGDYYLENLSDIFKILI